MASPHRLSSSVAPPVMLMVLLAFASAASAAGEVSGGRKLQATCHVDDCGVWCGAPRPPPCGQSASTSPPGKCQGSYGMTEHLGWGFSSAGQICKCFDGQFKECQPTSPPKASCISGNGKEFPDGAFGQNDQWKNCKCDDGKWKQCKWGKTCWANGIQFADGTWALNNDNAQCKCSNGAWTQCKTAPPAQEEQQEGCFGDLPFGLENCVCDGAAVGEMAGLAACGRVSTECLPAIAGFSVEDGSLVAVQQICDTFALDSCMSAAQVAPVVNEACGELLRFGTPACSPEQAMSIFMGTVGQSCDPLCKDCVRA